MLGRKSGRAIFGTQIFGSQTLPPQSPPLSTALLKALANGSAARPRPSTFWQVMDLVDDVLDGTNATAMCYGQTGSGKTFTALGFVNHNPLSGSDLGLVARDTGMYLRIFRDLLLCKKRKKHQQHILFSLSVVEVYNEQVLLWALGPWWGVRSNGFVFSMVVSKR